MWYNIDHALRCGSRSLPGGDTLAALLNRRLRAPARQAPWLTVPQILGWIDACRAATGRRPTKQSLSVVLPQGERLQKAKSVAR
jgi:hypothetical protein